MERRFARPRGYGVTPADPEDVTLALDLADAADRLTLAAFRRPDLAVETKPDLSPVTAADREVEDVLRKALAQARPDDSVLGEEFGAVGGAGGRRWIIDPIDGTRNFVRGVPVWATLLALEVGGAATVGVVSAPALSRRWWAGRGLGAFAGPAGYAATGPPSPIRVSAVSALDDAVLSGGGLRAWLERGDPGPAVALGLRCWNDRSFGDFWSHVLVAEGACDIGLDPVASLWDLAALQVIVEEAGGRFTNLEGEARADGGSGISSNGLLHDGVLALLAGKDVVS
jgi:histidinol-phosphatase